MIVDAICNVAVFIFPSDHNITKDGSKYDNGGNGDECRLSSIIVPAIEHVLLLLLASFRLFLACAPPCERLCLSDMTLSRGTLARQPRNSAIFWAKLPKYRKGLCPCANAYRFAGGNSAKHLSELKIPLSM